MLHTFECRPFTFWWIFASQALSDFSGPCSRCSYCVKNRATYCGLDATDLTKCNAKPSTGLFCDWTHSKGDKCACISNSVYEAWNNKHFIASILCDKNYGLCLCESWGSVD